jgi:hypothetical protein
MEKTDFEAYLDTIPCTLCRCTPRIFMEMLHIPGMALPVALYFMRCCGEQTKKYTAGNVWNMLEDWERLQNYSLMKRHAQ